MSIAKTLAWLGLIGWIGGGTYWHVCRIKGLCEIGPVQLSSSRDYAGLFIEDSTLFQVRSSNNLGFIRSGADPSLEVVRPELDSLAKYLRANPTKKLTITGFYDSEEKNNTVFPSLGIARASRIKQYLIRQGVVSEKIAIDGISKVLAFTPEDSTYGMAFTFITIPELVPPKAETEKELAASQKYESIFKPMDLYFPLGSSQYIKTPDNEKFVDEAKKYLAENPERVLMLTGHTDSQGADNWNLSLSKRRAESVKQALMNRGIKAKQLITDGKGETEPISNNETEAGRKANRRVSILVVTGS
ncbi:MAG: OmpA family protein [Siphonobacter sp.]